MSYPSIEAGILVAPASQCGEACRIVDDLHLDKKVAVVSGGSERWQSVENGVRAATSEWVLIHDAARPFVTGEVIDRILAMRDRFDCVITATPEVDTVRSFSGDLAGAVVDRTKLVRVGTPQLFRRARLLDAFKLVATMPTPPTDEAALMQEAGIPVGIAAGDPMNFKITTPADLTIAEALLDRQK